MIKLPDNIDSDMIDIIRYFFERGIETRACCDGVLAHHKIPRDVTSAYIAFSYNLKVIELMAAVYRDKSFVLSIINAPFNRSYKYFGNTFNGNSYGVYFPNKKGERTHYFEKIAHGVVDGKISIPEEEINFFLDISDTITSLNPQTSLYIHVDFHAKYQPYMRRNGTTNRISIRTYDDYGEVKNVADLVKKLHSEFGITIQSSNTIGNWQNLPDEFISYGYFGTDCEIYFQDNRLQQISQLIKHIILDLEPTLPMLKISKLPEIDDD